MDWAIIAKVFGAIGLLLITGGVLTHQEIKQDWLFVTGGILLLSYSSYLRDPIFIPLQIIFTAASLYEIYKIHRVKSRSAVSQQNRDI